MTFDAASNATAVSSATDYHQSEMRQSMFGALKRFIQEKVVGSDQESIAFEYVEVSDPNFWPHIIARCRLEWKNLDY